MTETPPYSTQASQAASAEPAAGDVLRSLRRSSSNRMVAGVLGGLGGRIGIDPVVLRVTTAVLAMFGGVGVLLYALGWLLVPADNEAGSIADQALGRVEPRGRHAVPLAVGLVIVVLVSGNIVVSGSLVTTLLLVLAVGGGYMWLRSFTDHEQDEPTTPDAPADEYPRSWQLADGYRTESSPEGTSDAPPSETESTPYAEPEPLGTSAGRTTGGVSGWPHGPDWGPYQAPWQPAPEPQAETETKPAGRSPLGPITICVALVALGVMAVNDVTWATFPPPLYVAVALGIIGVGLVIGSWFGRSRGLITLGIVLSLALAPTTWIDQYGGTSGAVSHEVATVGGLPSEPVQHAAGELKYNLSDLVLAPDETAELDVDLGLGDLEIVVPPEANLDVILSIGLGDATIRSEKAAGFDVEINNTFAGHGAEFGTIVLNLDAAVGDVKVIDATENGARFQ